MTLFEHLRSIKISGVPVELRVGLERVLRDNLESIFDQVKSDYTGLNMRAEDLIVKLVVREILNELKGYLGL